MSSVSGAQRLPVRGGYKEDLKGAGLVHRGAWRGMLRGEGEGVVTQHSSEELEDLSSRTEQAPFGWSRELFMPSHIRDGTQKTQNHLLEGRPLVGQASPTR